MWVHQIEITNFLNLAPFKSYLFLIHILNNSHIKEFKISFISLKILVQDFFTRGRFNILEGGGGGSNIFIRSRMRAFFIRGRNILFFNMIRGIFRGHMPPLWFDSSHAYVPYAPRLENPLINIFLECSNTWIFSLLCHYY